MILESFQSYIFHGQVMAAAHLPGEYEIEEDDLGVLLKGKEWRTIDVAYLDANEDDYLLMSAPAVVAFLGAWLWRAVDNWGSRRNQILYFLVSSLRYFGGKPPDKGGLWATQFRLLSQEQRSTILHLLECAADIESSSERKEEILGALKNVRDNLDGWPRSG